MCRQDFGLTDDELPIQVTADLIEHKISYEFDGEVFNTDKYDSLDDMIENALTGLDFSDLVYVPDDVADRHTKKTAPQEEPLEVSVSKSERFVLQPANTKSAASAAKKDLVFLNLNIFQFPPN